MEDHTAAGQIRHQYYYWRSNQMCSRKGGKQNGEKAATPAPEAAGAGSYGVVFRRPEP
jgi:hypothetical protein